MHSFRKHRSKNPSTTPRNTNISEYKQQVVNKMKCLHSKMYIHRNIFSMFHWNCVTMLSYQQMPRGLHLQLHPYLAITIMHRQNFKSSIIIILTGVTLLQIPLVISSNIHPRTFEMEMLWKPPYYILAIKRVYSQKVVRSSGIFLSFWQNYLELFMSHVICWTPARCKRMK